MKFKFRHTDKIVGIFFFSAVLVLVLSFVIIALSQKMLEKKYDFHTIFPDAVGLSPSTVLKFRGFEIGKVKSYVLNDDNLIETEIIIYEDYRNKIVANSAINKSSNPITGKSSLEFLQGADPEQVLPEGSFIPSLNMPEGQRLLEAGLIEKKGDAISSILDNVDQMLYNLNRDENADQGSIFRMIYNLANASEKLDLNMGELNQLLVLLNSDLKESMHNLDLTLHNASIMLENYSQPEGLLARMIDPEGDQLLQPLGNSLRQLEENLGELEKLLEFIGSQAPEIAEILIEGKNSLQTAQNTLEGINNNPFIRGGIGKESPLPGSSGRTREKDIQP
ncbi:MAG: MCE family protein [Candidatus Cloacimonetes bacterium]|nr:MCE family protein [Candidatus Cloacimonadota bacterium]